MYYSLAIIRQIMRGRFTWKTRLRLGTPSSVQCLPCAKEVAQLNTNKVSAHALQDWTSQYTTFDQAGRVKNLPNTNLTTRHHDLRNHTPSQRSPEES